MYVYSGGRRIFYRASFHCREFYQICLSQNLIHFFYILHGVLAISRRDLRPYIISHACHHIMHLFHPHAFFFLILNSHTFPRPIQWSSRIRHPSRILFEFLIFIISNETYPLPAIILFSRHQYFCPTNSIPPRSLSKSHTHIYIVIIYKYLL